VTIRRLAHAALLFVALAAVACDTPTILPDTEAYDPTAITGFTYNWGAGREISIYVDVTAAPANADLEAAVREAIGAWSAVGRLGEIRLRIVSSFRQADVIIHHTAAPRLVTSPLCSPVDVGSGGYTFFCVDENNRPIPLLLNDGSDGRVQMDISINRARVDTEEIFRAVVAHEIGHVLGIGAHSPDMNDLMFGSPRRLQPSARDARTLRFVLGQQPDIRF